MAEIAEHRGGVEVGVGIVGLLGDHPLEGGQGQQPLPEQREHAPQSAARLDVVGLDVSLAIQQTLYREFREPGFSPSPRLEHLVTAGYLGRKTGRGFRAYA